MCSLKWLMPSACAVVFQLAWCTDADACRRHRCRSSPAPSCVVSDCGHYVPHWVRWIDLNNRVTVTTCASHEMRCWCCKSGMWQACVGSSEKCDGIKQCLDPNTTPWQLGLICPSTYSTPHATESCDCQA